ncbi:uncharacterized protein LOC102302012 isoform X1 [Haplochromis burtoni]|uniref:Uncharacterized LOC102302012 n=1 Tax=Haplochromis burtoni TaxID=8153 RepID=A0A3Q3CK30_HAPBU|nr:uncharacterized protein LOC102302012 isoform X1 [Haplochromis burtoni]
MKLLLLLILSLMTGCELLSEEKICTKGWVEFTCNQNTNRKCQMTKASTTEQNTLRVIIKQHQTKNSSADSEELEFKIAKQCPKAFHQIAYRTAKTTIRCDYPEDKYKSWIKFFCKGEGFTCEDNLSTKSYPKSNRTFTPSNISHSFNMSISNVSSQDDGIYWCGVRSPEGIHHAALTKIKLSIKNIKSFTRSPAVGENFTYWCKYNQTLSNYTKFICKGEDPSICTPLVSTRDPNRNKRFWMNDNKKKKNITMTVREVTVDDSGTYWCGAESTNEHRSNRFFNRLSLTVGPTASAESHGISDVGIVLIIITGLVFLVVFILVYRRISFSKCRGANAALQHAKELKDCTYEEIQERPQQPDQPENALTSIYVTASVPTAASPLYDCINFESCSDKAGGEALKRSSSACEYSTLTLSKCPTNPTITQPSRPAEENLYSVINEPEPK